MPYSNLSDLATPAAILHAQTLTAAATGTLGWVNMASYERVQFVVDVGSIGANATIDATVKQATDTSGTGTKVLTTTKTITQITASNKMVVVNLKATELDVNNSFNCASLLITVGTASAVVQGVVLGDPQATPPALLTGVTQVVA